MKTLDDLTETAGDLVAGGLSRGEIADELNVSRETAAWLVERATDGEPVPDAPSLQDIHVDWSTIGVDSGRLAHVGAALADAIGDEDEVDLVVGIERAGVPLATTIARELHARLATYAPRKHQWEEGDIEDLGGSFSRNFAAVDGQNCVVVDDTITSGTTMTETIDAIREEGGDPVACGVLVDKRGVGVIDDVPVESLVQVIQVSEE